MKVKRSSLRFALLLGFLVLAWTPLAALPPAADPVCPAEDALLLALTGGPEAALLPGSLPAPAPASACPANFCAQQLQECRQGCPCGFVDCDPVACWSNCVCPIICLEES